MIWLAGVLSILLVVALALSVPLEIFAQRGVTSVLFHGAGLRIDRHARSAMDEFWIATQDPEFVAVPRFSSFGGAVFITIPIWPLAVASILATVWLWRRQRTARRRERLGLCAACGYPRSGGTDACPECGYQARVPGGAVLRGR